MQQWVVNNEIQISRIPLRQRDWFLNKIQFGSYKEQTIIRLGIFTDGAKFRLPLYLKKESYRCPPMSAYLTIEEANEAFDKITNYYREQVKEKPISIIREVEV